MKAYLEGMNGPCLYCGTNLATEEELEEHVEIHKTLLHKKLPVRFKTTTLAKSALPFISAYFKKIKESKK